jgi:peptidoglycan hydrolase-like protein with peptidoglycan-binding domain
MSPRSIDDAIPAYRTLTSGLTGEDVAELNADLIALGYATSTEIPSGTNDFTHWTEAGVEKLQAAVGMTQSGTLSLGQAVFEPTAVRVTTISATLARLFSRASRC